MNNDEFKEKIYDPYLEAWKILKTVQDADQTSASDEKWHEYVLEIDGLRKQYPDNKFVGILIRMLYDAGDVIARMNNKENGNDS